ncbi:helix-turn-helix transcriptional regulator [Streptomyces sp. NBC_01498]|uniref:winged helix-turn-helix transcriptional regulator n=1 Tax=Streptomyces sp. NBC_01498 TaxID=2975870 RepID=UPI002E7BFF6C|nr:helix-turn-helix domain-containing protein [Streptomyces sp. NBC_01498]WTL27197.1 helix-turn-helix transcriptional regulator [Streptomyces sp. NBC_01498]
MTTRTAAERQADARSAHLVRVAACPANRLLERVGEKWTALVLKELAGGPRRYGDLARTLAGVTPKMLTQTLRRLERDGLVARTVTPAVPVRVEYALTALGQSLMPVLRATADWAERNMDQVEAARRSYDAAQRRSS